MEYKKYIDYTAEERAKSEFVETDLVYTCQMATDRVVENLTYLKSAESDDEFVRVGTRETHFLVNVSCDSRLAMAKDVVCALLERGY